MEESEDLQGNVLKLSSVRLGGGLKSTASGRSTPRSSPSFRRLRTPRRELKGVWGKVQWFSGNRLLIWLIIIVVWAYAGFYIQSNWAHNEQSKADFISYTSNAGGVEKVEDTSRTIDTLVDDVTNSTGLDPVILRGNEENGSNFGINLFGKQGNVTSSKNATTRSNKRIARRLRRKRRFRPKVVPVENEGVEVDEGIPRKNTSYGLFVGPFRKIEDDILGWKGKKKRGACDSQSEFAQRVSSRKFVLVFHELSMTGAPLSMMELATEILSCGGTVSVVALSQRGGLMGELTRRGIKVLNDKAELSYKVAIKADLVVAGSAVCSSWIEKYLSHYNSGSNQILWWIMENRREYFDRSKDMLNKVKSVAFLSELQSEQWLTWCKEEHIQLKTQPTIVPLSVNDELAFVAGIPCSLNTPSLTVEKMLEKRTLLRVAVRKEMGLADDDMLVMSLSSINPGKGQRLFLESIVLMSEQKVPSVDHKINSLKNLSDIDLQDEKVAHGRQLRGQFQHVDELGNVIPQSNKSRDGDVRKRREYHSRLSNIVTSIISHKYQSQDAHTSRNLLSESSGREYPTPKVLIGSIGSKSNKVLYVKEILRFLSQHSNMSKSLLWTPATTHVSSLYAAADVYVINAQGLGETFGRVTIEAMAFGLPVLGTDAGGTKEIVKDKVMGLLHPIGRNGILPLAQNLQFLLSNPSARKQLGKNGRMKVEQTYLKQHMYKKLAESFAQCLKIK